MIVRCKKEKPHWGARKIRELLVRRLAGDVRIPAKSTVHAVLDRHGLVQRGRQRRRNKAKGTALSPGSVLACEALDSTKEKGAFAAFLRLFRERGLPQAIRSDNGLPFASPNGLYNLSKLSVWWLRLGIQIERIKPGQPQQNGRHERMHLTLKRETTRPAAINSLQQQARFDDFVKEFNSERPHEALNMKCPEEFYEPAPRRYHGLPEVEYPGHDKDVLVTACGRICMHRKKINISTVMAGQRLGIKEVDDAIWLVSFMHYDLGNIDLEQKTLQTIDNPFAPRLSPMS
jgi:transposase InsO family protein